MKIRHSFIRGAELETDLTRCSLTGSIFALNANAKPTFQFRGVIRKDAMKIPGDHKPILNRKRREIERINLSRRLIGFLNGNRDHC